MTAHNFSEVMTEGIVNHFTKPEERQDEQQAEASESSYTGNSIYW